MRATPPHFVTCAQCQSRTNFSIRLNNVRPALANFHRIKDHDQIQTKHRSREGAHTSGIYLPDGQTERSGILWKLRSVWWWDQSRLTGRGLSFPTTSRQPCQKISGRILRILKLMASQPRCLPTWAICSAPSGTR
ncbi:hypothetical protein RvY_09651-3 [Ramazzottius varieornatus]|uniref:Uncharacterized protein n=1 Tax=Ramazzottius varieornatus TaxID=947166 RepID=A0A1D1VA55_RAMVA|nr:hypothetical protein RvY_09651-3 [Ramazzottius varieornatus]